MDALGAPAKPRAAWFCPADEGEGIVKDGETIFLRRGDGNLLPQLLSIFPPPIPKPPLPIPKKPSQKISSKKTESLRKNAKAQKKGEGGLPAWRGFLLV
jgi:hypothetical protein